MPCVNIRRSWTWALTVIACRLASAGDPCHAQTTVFVVRHAEQTSHQAKDPPLSQAGNERAAALAQMLELIPLTAALASEFERTLQTVQPAADGHGLPVTRYRAADTAGLAKEITTKHAGGTVLVAGHSNTVPLLLASLGADKALIPEIGLDEFDDLFVVFIGKAGDVTVQRLRYGTSIAAGDGSSMPEAAPRGQQGPRKDGS